MRLIETIENRDKFYSFIYFILFLKSFVRLIYVTNTLIIDLLQTNFICDSPKFNNALFYYDNYHCNKLMDW